MSDLGYYTLQLTFLIACAGLIAGILGGALKRGEWARVSVRAMLLTFGATSLSIVCLFYAFATLDLQLSYVASHASRDMPTFYRIAALWGGQAGSLLLWLWMLTAYGALAVWINRRSERLIPWVCAALQTNVVFFLILLNFVSNPFEKLPPEAVLSDGAGLNPLLQHPVMLIHPLVLYMGLTGFAVPFAFGLGAMLTGQIGTAWLRTTRRWTLFAWCFLSIGILLGGRWAYEVLGWGGYWAWDPVENASFMPWLAATAYLHSVMVQEKRDMLKTWNLVLVGMTYILCIFGTMLTRSGLVRSVHAFAQTEIFGILFLGYVLLTTVVFYGVLFWRRPLLRSQNQLESVVSRESGFLINNWIFMAILGVVFCGTLFPKVTEWFGKEILVGPAYFNAVSAPLALLLLVLTGIGPLIAWRRATLSNLRRQFVWPTLFGVATGIALVIALGADAGFFPLLTWALSAFVVASLAQEYWRAIRGRMRRGENPAQALATLMRKNQRRYGGYVVHLGVVFIFIGIAGAAFNEERLENLAVGDEIAMNGYRLSYRTAKAIPMQHYGGAEARIALYHGDEPLVTMTPEKRMYWLEQQPASIPSVYSTLQEDLYVILTAIEPDGSATLKIYRNPLVNWIWIGGYTFVFGTILIMWPHPERSSGRPA